MTEKPIHEKRFDSMISKVQQNLANSRFQFFYYERARDAMKDAVIRLVNKGYSSIHIPGYIGWASKEGSGIFDPLNGISGLKRYYYRMDKQLHVDVEDLDASLQQHSILLLVNYFGFRDERFPDIVRFAHARNCVVIEDNAHGFFTYFCSEPMGTDLTFFSLHKMFPFSSGGGLLIENPVLDIRPANSLPMPEDRDPFSYHLAAIAHARRSHFEALMHLIEGKERLFIPFRQMKDIEDNVPQTFPILILQGDRDRIYEIMNEAGYGVVSLYHTMIKELQNARHQNACWVAAHIMNLPVHQDCDEREYPGMVDALVAACKQTSR